MAATGQDGVIFPPADLDALADVTRFLDRYSEPALLVSSNGEHVRLPADVYRLVAEVVQTLREGKVVTLVPRAQRLTTHEAADFLEVSQATLEELLEDGKIPYDQPGSQRRILFADLLAYEEREHADQRAALDEMTREASEAGLYGDTLDDYAAELKRARERGSGPSDPS